MIKASAPGKLLLLGDHAVVYNYPCLVTTVDKRMFITVKKIDNNYDVLHIPQAKDDRFVRATVSYFKERFSISDSLEIKTSCDFSNNYGFGSSSAVVVTLMKALSDLFHKELSREEIFKTSHEINLFIQKVGSGYDIAAATYGETLYYLTGGQIIEPLEISSLPLIVGYSGLKASTPALINQVKTEIGKNPKKIKHIFEEMKKLVDQGKWFLLQQNLSQFGELMIRNHQLLQQLGVSTVKLDAMVKAAMEAGAWGAKLSGAGGGDCIIILASEENREAVETAVEKVGGEVIRVTTNVEGVRTEYESDVTIRPLYNTL